MSQEAPHLALLSMDTDACPKCGHVIAIGEFPYCTGKRSDHGPWTTAEEPLEARYDEHLSTEGKTFTTRGERRRYMDKNAIEPRKQPKILGSTLFFDMGKR